MINVDALNVVNGNKDLLMVIDNKLVIKEICKGIPELPGAICIAGPTLIYTR